MVEASLYFHIPFCKKKCDYCHFYVVHDRQSYKQLLMEGFRKEWELNAPLLKNKTISSIYFGGGTPALLGPDNIQKILSWIPYRKIEITLEANPEDVTNEVMTAYKKAGINRVSLGVQSLDDRQLVKISRQHSAEKAMQAVQITQDAGIHNITIDLMYDLPDQTLESWQNTLNQAVTLPITHLSLYNLTIEPHTAFHKYRHQIKEQQPTQEASTQMYEMAVKVLSNNGLEQYEISAFAKKEEISYHNIGYWTGRPFLGFGPSAFSYWEGERFRNIANLNKWHHALTGNKSPIDYREELTYKSKIRELLVVNLRLLKGVKLSNFEIDQELQDEINKLIDSELLVKEGEQLQLTKKGILFYDTVASELI